MDKIATANSRFAKAGLSCFYNSEVLNSSFVHLMKFSTKNPRLRKAAKRYLLCLGRPHRTTRFDRLTTDICRKRGTLKTEKSKHKQKKQF